ncbi:MAG TPA: sensor histidine kinase [Burkholderiales bacterium]|nr:sensor histidine kinase [Burkholderiales bacterium]
MKYGTPRTTLRSKLLIWLLAPLTAVALISAITGYYIALRFSTLAYDRTLFETARDISNQVSTVANKTHVDLPSVTLDMIRSDQWDRIYYMVSGPDSAFIAGDPGLPRPPAGSPSNKPIYYDARYLGEPVRVAALYRPMPNSAGTVLVQAAETLNKRRILANEILFAMLLPELILISLVGLVVWYGVARGLRPLTTLQQEIGSRSHHNLSPLPETGVPDEVRPLIHAMNNLLTQLNEAISAQRRFIADAAHQLRTPLAGLKTQMALALRQDDLKEVRATLHHLDTATANITHMVNQLLSLARAEPGAYCAQTMHKIDLAALARDVTGEWVPQALAKSIDLGFSSSLQSAWIEGDPTLVKEMLGNVLDNAIRYTPSGGQVTVLVEPEDEGLSLEVHDNGQGIPETERELVFERFHRVLGNQAEGCGLGLAIVREIANGHGAHVTLKPGTNGAGTCVTVLFKAVIDIRE